ncbi:kinase [Fusarium pseudocircinatum]|uniref:Kinase n=1 Tax=Fusarium pseudocircinatum TaxID=56676 RepID=A0A8H5UNY7_9HYPO|nr:kinase [Fusarium pseudocircinatum]
MQQSVKRLYSHTSTDHLGDCAEVMKVDHIDPRKRSYGTRAYWTPYREARMAKHKLKAREMSPVEDTIVCAITTLALRRTEASATATTVALAPIDQPNLGYSEGSGDGDALESQAVTPASVKDDKTLGSQGLSLLSWPGHDISVRCDKRIGVLRNQNLSGFLIILLPAVPIDIIGAAPGHVQFVKKTIDSDPDIVKKYYSYNWKGQSMDEMVPLVGKETHGTVEFRLVTGSLDAEWIVTWRHMVYRLDATDCRNYTTGTWEAAQKTSTNGSQGPMMFFDTIGRVIDGRSPFRDQMVEQGEPSQKAFDVQGRTTSQRQGQTEARSQLSKIFHWSIV